MTRLIETVDLDTAEDLLKELLPAGRCFQIQLGLETVVVGFAGRSTCGIAA